MVSWGYAFDKGLVAFVLVVGWQVLGFLIAGGISGGALLAIFQNPTVFAQSFLVILIGLVIGGMVASIGTYATIIKISVESAQELRLRDEAAEEGQEFDEQQQTLDDYSPQPEKDVRDERTEKAMSYGTDFDRRQEDSGLE